MSQYKTLRTWAVVLSASWPIARGQAVRAIADLRDSVTFTGLPDSVTFTGLPETISANA
jgi:hypothetical protein